MSDSDEKYSLPAKMEKYLQNGVRLGWMIDSFQQQTTVYQSDHEPVCYPFDALLSGDPVLPGFTLQLSPIVR